MVCCLWHPFLCDRWCCSGKGHLHPAAPGHGKGVKSPTSTGLGWSPVLRARARPPSPPSPSSLPPPASETVLVTQKISDICNLRLFKGEKSMQEYGGADAASDLCAGGSWCSPFILLHLLLGNMWPWSQCHHWCQTCCLCPCARARMASAPGSWCLRTKVVRREKWLGQSSARCPNQPQGSIVDPTAASGDTHTQPGLCCWSSQPNCPGSHSGQAPLGVLTPPAHRCDPTRVLESHQKPTAWAQAMAWTTFLLAVASSQQLSCGRMGPTSDRANLTSKCL